MDKEVKPGRFSPRFIIKRSGDKVPYQSSKIKNAIMAANMSEPDTAKRLVDEEIETIVNQITMQVYSTEEVFSVEQIQDMVEKLLSESGHFEVAKSYILYRKQHESVRKTKDTLLDYQKVVDGYLNVEDWRVKENSTVSYSLGGLILGNSGAVTANYWLNKVYDKEIADAHRDVRFHIHDLSMLSGYCFTGDTHVKTLDGKNPTFEELVESGTKELWVFAYDIQNDKIIPTKAVNPRITRETSELMEIQMCDGTVIRCTPDHLFLMRDGTYMEARNLRANYSLMPLYIGEQSKYVSINTAWTSGKKYLHRWVVENIIGRPLADNEIVHHIDGNKHNNSPENLEVILDSDHRRLELTKTMKTETWRLGNRARLNNYNKSEAKRNEVSAFSSQRDRDERGRFVTTFAYVPEKDPDGTFYNHQIRKTKLIKLDEPIKVFDLTVPEYENFAIEGNVFVHNCAGWNLKQLIERGITGVGGRISSKPASHLSTLCNQMVNFLGIMQNEWAGAQAFSSFDTYLAPFVKADNLSYKQVKQAIQSLVFGLNTPSRWGCVKDTTKILTPSGWKSADELKVGDTIFTWVNGVMKEAPLRHIIRHKNDYGVLHQYKGRNYVQTVTPEHRCIVNINNSGYVIRQSFDIFGRKGRIEMPAIIEEIYSKNIDDSMTDAEIIIAASYYAGGKATILAPYSSLILGDKHAIDEKFLHLSREQSRLFIDTWAMAAGSSNERVTCRYFDDKVGDALEIIMLRAGIIPYRWAANTDSSKRPDKYVCASKRDSVIIAEQVEIPYDGDVWCPNTEDGTAIFKDEDGNIFISGNCQAPFTNVTIDWTVPDDLKDLPAIVGGKEMDFTYGDCKKEMDMINKAFIEVMVEGDADGRGFQYPIPTYSITKDFDWSETENNKLLFEMTAKYGIPYFSNYVNSDMEPSDIRSM